MGETALHAAASGGHVKVVKLFMEYLKEKTYEEKNPSEYVDCGDVPFTCAMHAGNILLGQLGVHSDEHDEKSYDYSEDNSALNKALALTKERGFGLRDDDYFIYKSFDPGPDLAALAVPILSKTGVHGALSILWMREEQTVEDVLAQGALDDLLSAAQKIGSAMDKNNIAAFKSEK